MFVSFMLLMLAGFGFAEDGFLGLSGKQEKRDPLLEKAEGIILAGLEHNEPYVKMHAIEVIVQTNLTGYMPKVSAMLKDKSVPVRAAAAIAIGDANYSGAVYKLENVLTDRNEDDNVKIAACYSLTKLEQGVYSSVLIRATRSSDQTVKANAIMLLGKLGDPKFIKLINFTVNDKTSSDKVRIQGVDSLAMLREDGIYSRIWTLLISKRADDRLMGVVAMGSLGSKEAKDAIYSMIHDDVLEVRLKAAEELGKLNEASGQSVVEDYFKEIAGGLGKAGRHRADLHAAMAIGQIRSESLRKYLPELMESESPSVKIAAAQSYILCITKRPVVDRFDQ